MRIVLHIPLSLALTALCVAPVPAQNTPHAPPPPRPPIGRIEVRRPDGRPMLRAWLSDSADAARGSVGMTLAATGTRRDTIGLFVDRVVPGGPAERAGIVEGDRIVSINGVDLRLAAADVDDPYTAGVPSHRASREIRKAAPGSAIRMRVYSGGRYRDVSVTAGKMSDVYKGRGARIIFDSAEFPIPLIPGWGGEQ